VLQVSQQLALRCIRLNPPFSLKHYKPEFMRAVLQLHEPLASAVAYLDPDLVVKCHWAEIDDWLAPYRQLWSDRLDLLEQHLDDMPDTEPGMLNT